MLCTKSIWEVRDMSIIRSIRGGSAGLNEEDRLTIAGLLIKAGYRVQIGYRVIPGNTKGKKEYVIEYEEIEQKECAEK
jgi:hypothetical protein